MSYYVYNSKLSYNDYLQGKSFIDDITSSNNRVAMEVSKQTRQLIASNETLARMDISSHEHTAERAMKHQTAITNEMTDIITNKLSEGFETLSYQMKDIDKNLCALNATFHWGFGCIITELGGMHDSIKELIKAAKNPAQIAAREHLGSAITAFKKKKYPLALEEISYALDGVPGVSAPYKLEWRTYQLLGVIRLGFLECDVSLVDLSAAEISFRTAAELVLDDSPDDAALAFLSAGWAAYCQGKMQDAIKHTEAAITQNPELGEAMFQLAKVYVAQNNLDKAFSSLESALNNDLFYSLKAASDGDFLNHSCALNKFLSQFTDMTYLRFRSVFDNHINTIQTDLCPTNIDQMYENLIENRDLLHIPEAICSWDNLKEQLVAFSDKLKRIRYILDLLQTLAFQIRDLNTKLRVININPVKGYSNIERFINDLQAISTNRVMGKESDFELVAKNILEYLKTIRSSYYAEIRKVREHELNLVRMNYDRSKKKHSIIARVLLGSIFVGLFGFIASLFYLFLASGYPKLSFYKNYSPGQTVLNYGLITSLIMAIVLYMANNVVLRTKRDLNSKELDVVSRMMTYNKLIDNLEIDKLRYEILKQL